MFKSRSILSFQEVRVTQNPECRNDVGYDTRKMFPFLNQTRAAQSTY
jgi:hypothetical protein